MCLDVSIQEVIEEIRAIDGVSIIDVYDIPGFQAVSFRGYPGPELLNDNRFVDYNATMPDINAEIDRYSGHNAQLSTNATQLDSSQVEPSGLERTIQGISLFNFTSINLESNNTSANINNTNVTYANASSLAPAAGGCAMQRVVPVLSKNVSATDLNVDIAVLDTGVSLTHPDLNVYRDVTFINGTSSGDDDQGHGSHVAGIASGQK